MAGSDSRSTSRPCLHLMIPPSKCPFPKHNGNTVATILAESATRTRGKNPSILPISTRFRRGTSWLVPDVTRTPAQALTLRHQGRLLSRQARSLGIATMACEGAPVFASAYYDTLGAKVGRLSFAFGRIRTDTYIGWDRLDSNPLKTMTAIAMTCIAWRASS